VERALDDSTSFRRRKRRFRRSQELHRGVEHPRLVAAFAAFGEMIFQNEALRFREPRLTALQ
jgi:hypothetical protein